MLRSIPSKAGGILVLLFSILLLFVLPYLKRCTVFTQEFYFNWSNRKFLFLNGLDEKIAAFLSLDGEKLVFWFFFVNCVLLGFIGSQPIEYPYLSSGRFFTIFYFVYFVMLFFLNKNGILEKKV